PGGARRARGRHRGRRRGGARAQARPDPVGAGAPGVRLRVRPAAGGLRGTLEVPGDKSISHRAALLGAIAEGPSEVSGYLEAEDCLRTLGAIQRLGVEVARKGPGHYRIAGVGLEGLQEPDQVLDCGNSGTTARLLLASLTYRPPVASAQVKSAVLLAGLWSEGPVVVEEPAASRDHSERMLRQFGARVTAEARRVTLDPGVPLRGTVVQVPGDISSAAFILVAATLVAGSRVEIRGVSLNPTRTGILDVLEAMGARVERRQGPPTIEPSGTLIAGEAELRGTTIAGALIPRLIDELP